jgi:hypothetical protein
MALYQELARRAHARIRLVVRQHVAGASINVTLLTPEDLQISVKLSLAQSFEKEVSHG